MAYIVALYSLVVGSFLNLCIYCIPIRQSLISHPSCTHCNTKIKFYDLIPIVSFLLLKGKCRFCKASIPIKYTLVEIMTCLLIVLMYLHYNLYWNFIFNSVVTCVLIVAAFIDMDELIVPDELVVFLFFAGAVNMVIRFFLGRQIIDALFYLPALALAGGLFYIIALITNGKMGGGDIKLMAALGLCLGLRLILLTIFLCFLFGAIISVILILAKVKSKTSPIAFVPFISLGAVISMLFGNKIIELYFNIIF